MTDLKTLADMLLRGQLPDNERAEVIGLLRAASTADCGMGWWKHTDPNGAKHNEEVQAARVAIALAKAEAAWLRAELLPAHAQAEEMSGKRAAMQDAIDAAVAEWDNVPVGGYINTGRIIDILRPHATPTPTLDASEYAKPPRQWQREYPAGVRFWLSWVDEGNGQRVTTLADERGEWWANRTSLHDGTWCLPWQEGDTEATLPPLPKSPAASDGWSHGKALQNACMAARHDDEETVDATARELIARLAEAIRAWILPSEPMTLSLIPYLDAIIADARRGGGA